MKAPKGMAGMEDVGATLKAAMNTPPGATAPIQAEPVKRGKGSGASASVFLRVPLDKHAELEAEARKRTMATGKGVTLQQIILERI